MYIRSVALSVVLMPPSLVPSPRVAPATCVDDGPLERYNGAEFPRRMVSIEAASRNRLLPGHRREQPEGQPDPGVRRCDHREVPQRHQRLSRVGRKNRESPFVRDNCKIRARCCTRRDVPGHRDAGTLEHPVSAGILNLVREVMSTVPPGEKSLIDLYHVRGNADPILGPLHSMPSPGPRRRCSARTGKSSPTTKRQAEVNRPGLLGGS